MNSIINCTCVFTRTYAAPRDEPQKVSGWCGAYFLTYANKVTASLTGPISSNGVPPESPYP